MRRLRPAVLAITVFWGCYAMAAAYLLYVEMPPLGQVLTLVLGGYAAILAVLSVVLLLRTRPAPPGGNHEN